MTQLSVREAATRVGVTRQTIFKKISNGELSATTDHRGNKQIDVTELLRVYGKLQSNDSQGETTVNSQRLSKVSMNAGGLQLELERARMQLQIKERELQLAEERIADLKAREAESKSRERSSQEEKQQLMTIIDRQTLLLAAPPAKAPARPKAAPVAKTKPQAKAQVAKAPAKPTATRKTAPKPAAKKATAKPVARSNRSTAAAAKTGTKKATKK